MNEQYKPCSTDWNDTNGQFILRLKYEIYLALVDKNKDMYYSSSTGFPEVTVNELMMAAYLAGVHTVKFGKLAPRCKHKQRFIKELKSGKYG